MKDLIQLESKVKKEKPDQEEVAQNGGYNLRKRKIAKPSEREIASRKRNKLIRASEVKKEVKEEPVEAEVLQQEQNSFPGPVIKEEAIDAVNSSAQYEGEDLRDDITQLSTTEDELVMDLPSVNNESPQVKEEPIHADTVMQEKCGTALVKEEPIDVFSTTELRDDVTQVSTIESGHLSSRKISILEEPTNEVDTSSQINDVSVETFRDDVTQVSVTEDEHLMDSISITMNMPVDDVMDDNSVSLPDSTSIEENVELSDENKDQEPVSAEVNLENNDESDDKEAGDELAALNKCSTSTFKPMKVCRFECFKCDKKYKSKQGLQRHNMVHLGDRPFSCLRCDMKFYRLDHLESHKRTHDGQKPFTCEVCNAEFARKTDLNKHERRHDKSPSYSCKLCGLVFREASALKCHLITHKGSKSFCCTECKEKFTTRKELEQQKEECEPEEATQRIASKKSKELECPDCLKHFFDASTLNRHKRIHSDIKPHKCDICDKPFSQLYNMKLHRNTHLDSEKKSILSSAVQSMKIFP